jgi:hypothetical protein
VKLHRATFAVEGAGSGLGPFAGASPGGRTGIPN